MTAQTAIFAVVKGTKAEVLAALAERKLTPLELHTPVSLGRVVCRVVLDPGHVSEVNRWFCEDPATPAPYPPGTLLVWSERPWTPPVRGPRWAAQMASDVATAAQTLETVAHLRGLESELLPVAERLRANRIRLLVLADSGEVGTVE